MKSNANATGAKPLIQWLLELHPDTPRTRAKQWILAGRVRVHGEIVRRPQEMIADPAGSLELLDRRSTTLDCGAGWQVHPRVSLLHLDSALAIVNKGPGLISVPAANAPLSALSILQDFLEGRLRAVERGVAGRSLPPVYRRLQLFPVHRLDQYTSGVFCMACNAIARGKLIEQLKAHTMRREYVAFVEGKAKTPKGTWRNWLELSDDQLRQRIVSDSQKEHLPSAEEAITHYEVVREYAVGEGTAVISKLRLRLETGRKHQIRIQAAFAGLPLIGDRTYHPGYRLKSTGAPLIEFPRQALHAETLSLEHPDQPGTERTWKAILPKDLRQLEARLLHGDL
jgi:23S rRNA pseudouridine1911/1915/1917 synthase